LEKITEVLLEKETLEGEEFRRLLASIREEERKELETKAAAGQ